MAFTRRYDGTEPQRVNKWLAQSGVCARREAEGLIAEGLVSVDGELVSDPGRKILPGQTLVRNPLQVVGGYVGLGDAPGPGLGVEIAEAALGEPVAVLAS